MTAAVQDRNTLEVRGRSRAFPLEAATKVYGGTIAALNASGNLTRAATSPALKCIGVAERMYDNSSGLAGDLVGEARVGIFGPWNNSTGADRITPADTGSDCYLVDDQTVARTDGGATRTVAGKVWSVEAFGVWVKFV